jgi:hypothetical protein
MDITINSSTNPTFTPMGPYCEGDVPGTLPTTSSNAITGTWSPSVISTASAGTNTYTFTPDAGQCALTTTMDITINSSTNPTFTPMGPYCVGATPAVLPSISTNGINGTWTPATISTASADTTTYTFTPDAGQCAEITSIDIEVTTSINAIFDIFGPYCLGSVPDALPSTSLNGITGSWNPSVISTASVGTTTYTFTPDAGQCAEIYYASIEVATEITPTFNSAGPYCKGETPAILPGTSINGITGIWSPSVISTASAGTTTYTFTPDAGQCAIQVSLNVSVNDNVTPEFSLPVSYCEGATPATLSPTSDNGVSGIWNPSVISTASTGTTIYYFTPDAGQCAGDINISITVNENIDPSFSIPNSYCTGETVATLPSTSTNGVTGIWAPSVISTASAGTTSYTFTPDAGQCASVITTDITVNNPATPTFNTFGPYCTGTEAPALPSTSLNGISGTWNPSVISTASVGTTSYTFTPDAGQCAEIFTTDITIGDNINATFSTFGPYCTGDIADLLPTTSNNNITGTWNPSVINTNIAGTYSYVFTPDAGQCAGPYTMNVTITSGTTPPFNVMGPYCLGSTPGILPTIALNGVSGTWSPSMINTSAVGTTIYTFTPYPGQCATTATLSITVNPEYEFTETHNMCSGNTYNWHGMSLTSPGTYTVNHPSIYGCDSVYILNLTVFPEYEYIESHTICPGSGYTWHGNTYSSAGTYYANYTTLNGCDSVYVLNLSIGEEYAFTENHSICEGDSYLWHGNSYSGAGTYTAAYSTNNGCDSIYTLDLAVSPLPVVWLGNDTTICADEETLTLDAGNTGATYLWSENAATSQSIQFTCTGCNPGVYPIWVTVDNGCTASDTININIQLCDIIDESGNILLSLYPNPTEGLVYLSTNGMYSDVQITLTHADGRIIYQGMLQDLSGSAELKEFDLSHYAAGFYFLHISSDVHSKTIKIVRD